MTFKYPNRSQKKPGKRTNQQETGKRKSPLYNEVGNIFHGKRFRFADYFLNWRRNNRILEKNPQPAGFFTMPRSYLPNAVRLAITNGTVSTIIVCLETRTAPIKATKNFVSKFFGSVLLPKVNQYSKGRYLYIG